MKTTPSALLFRKNPHVSFWRDHNWTCKVRGNPDELLGIIVLYVPLNEYVYVHADGRTVLRAAWLLEISRFLERASAKLNPKVTP